MTIEQKIADVLGEAIECEDAVTEAIQLAGLPPIYTVRSFADAGVLTTNAGVVIRFTDGSEFQLSIVRSR